MRLHYYPETEALLKQQTGAVKVVIFDHTIRVDDPIGAPVLSTPLALCDARSMAVDDPSLAVGIRALSRMTLSYMIDAPRLSP